MDVEMQYREYRRSELLILNSSGEMTQRVNLSQLMPVNMHEIESISVISEDNIYVIGSEKIAPNQSISPKIIVPIDANGSIKGDPIRLNPQVSSPANEYDFSTVAINEDGILCARNGGGGGDQGILYFFDKDGEKLFTLEDTRHDYENGWMITDILVDKSTFYVMAMYHKDSLYYLIPVDTETQSFQDRIPMLVNTTNTTVMDGVVYTADSESVQSYHLTEQKSSTLLLWTNQDISFSPQETTILPISNDTLLMYQWGFDAEKLLTYTSFRLLTRAASNPHADKTLLQLGGIWLDNETWLREAIQQYNNQSETTRIQVTDLAKQIQTQGVNLSDVDTIIQSMYLSGEVPDILYTGSQDGVANFSFYASKGLFTDLRTLMESDDSFNREDYLDLPFDLPAVDGKLFYTFSSFSIGGLRTKTQNLGDRDGWTLDEIEILFSTLPTGTVMYPESRFNLLLQMGFATLDDLIDTTNKTANFESDFFRKILSFCKNHGMSNEEWTEYQATLPFIPDTSILEGSALRNGSLQMSFSQGCSTPEMWKWIWNSVGPDATLAGYPTESGNYLVCTPGNLLAISEKCENKEVAWDFIKFLLSESYSQTEIPVSKTHIEKRIQKEMKPISPHLSSITELTPLTESGAYFSGQKSLDDTTRIIQDKVQVYLNQMG